MKLVIQRITHAAVSVDKKEIARTGRGLLILLGIAKGDTAQDVQKMARKIVNMRIFSDNKGKFNQSVLDSNGEILVISQFTLMANTKKGNRPSFVDAAPSETANTLYIAFARELRLLGVGSVKTGEFGEHMQVSLVNDGPVTITI